MKRMWPYLYLSLAIVSFLGGTGLFAKRQAQMNIDGYFIAICFLVCAIFPLGTVAYARSRLVVNPPSPSLFRGFTGGWRTDPWQWILLSTLLSCSSFLGSLFTLPHVNDRGVMAVWWNGSLATGLVVGYALARKIYLGKSD
jgi:hypothetical protein